MKCFDDITSGGVPTIIFFNRQGKEEKDLRIESLVTRDDFLDRIKTVGGKTGPFPPSGGIA